jgi:hypothetical protein
MASPESSSELFHLGLCAHCASSQGGDLRNLVRFSHQAPADRGRDSFPECRFFTLYALPWRLALNAQRAVEILIA